MVETTHQPVYAANVSRAKYQVTNKYYLVVKDGDPSDAVPYFCSSPNASNVDNHAYANLVVIGAFWHTLMTHPTNLEFVKLALNWSILCLKFTNLEPI